MHHFETNTKNCNNNNLLIINLSCSFVFFLVRVPFRLFNFYIYFFIFCSFYARCLICSLILAKQHKDMRVQRHARIYCIVLDLKCQFLFAYIEIISASVSISTKIVFIYKYFSSSGKSAEGCISAIQRGIHIHISIREFISLHCIAVVLILHQLNLLKMCFNLNFLEKIGFSFFTLFPHALCLLSVSCVTLQVKASCALHLHIH